MTDIPITELLESLGLTAETATKARGILEDAGVTHSRKQRIALAKSELVETTLDERLQRVCHSCRTRAVADGREIVLVPPATCPVCRGSANRRAVREMVEACRRANVLRLVVVGGSPAMRDGAVFVGTLEKAWVRFELKSDPYRHDWTGELLVEGVPIAREGASS